MKFWNFLWALLMPLVFMAGEDEAGGGGVTVDDEAEGAEAEGDETGGEAEEEAEAEETAEGEEGAEEAADAGKKKVAAGADPTEGMTPEQLRAELKRIKIAEKSERVRRQTLEKRYGKGVRPPANDPARRAAAENGPKSLEDVKDIGDYDKLVERKIEERLQRETAERTLSSRLESTQSEMSKKFDGSNGLPGYDEIVDEHVVPMIEENPMVYHLIRMAPNPGGFAYLLALNAKYGGDIEKIAGAFKVQGRKQLLDNIDKAGKQALRLKGRGGVGSSGKGQSLEQLMAMDDDAFENEIGKAKGSR